MASRERSTKRPTKKRPTNVTLDADLVREAREFEINLSQEFERHLERLVSEQRAARWREENRRALEAYARFFEKHGIWNEEVRGW